jgi:alpha-N-acetylglucosamine transferase
MQIDIFHDPAVEPQKNKHKSDKNAVKADEALQPDEYVFASNARSGGYDHPLPPPMGNNLKAGILVFQPSIELFNCYVSLTTPETEKRFNGRYPEQGLGSYAHRRDGNMPWQQLDWRWNMNHACYNDIVSDIASVYSK